MRIDLSGLIQHLSNMGARKVAIQLPEGLKRESHGIAMALRAEGFEPVVSGKPCYGACDIDTEALSLADVLVHFGHAPIGGVDRVIFEPVQIDFEIEKLAQALPLLRGRRIGLVTTVQHVHMVGEMQRYLREHGVEAVVAEGGGRTPFPGQVLGCNYRAARRTGADEILFVGTGLFHPVGVALATGARVVALDPLSGSVQEASAERLLRRRHAIMEQARGAESTGVILSTKSGQRRLELARALVRLSEKAVLVAMEEVTPEALLNLGMECYVNTACPRLAYDDSVRFPVPVLTPEEFEILTGHRRWEEYTIDEMRER